MDKVLEEFFHGSLSPADVKSEFGEDNFRQCMAESRDKCFKYAEQMSKTSSEFSSCSVCQERGANYYLVHGDTAHKCVCSVCAMKIALGKPACPLCRRQIDLFVESPDSSPVACVCGQRDCRRMLVVSQRSDGQDKTPDQLVPFRECFLCTLGNLEVEKCSLLFAVY